MKLYLCKVICGMYLKDYLYKVIIPCGCVIITSSVFAYILQQSVGNIHVVKIVIMQFLVISILEFVFGLTKYERQLIFSKVIKYISRKNEY